MDTETYPTETPIVTDTAVVPDAILETKTGPEDDDGALAHDTD